MERTLRMNQEPCRNLREKLKKLREIFQVFTKLRYLLKI